MANHDQDDPMRWFRRGLALAIVAIGWVFIAWQNNFHVTPPVVVVCLAYFALVATIYNLWRTGAAAVSTNDEDDGDSTWGKPLGEIGELEREKRTLLKAIKEAEFDFQMHKLSKVDADEMIAIYRARAIEVIKELERLDRAGGKVGTAREQIEREVRARLEVVVKPQKKADAAVKKEKQEAKGKKGDKAEPADKPVDAPEPADEAKAETESKPVGEAVADATAETSGPEIASAANDDSKGDKATSGEVTT